MNNFSLSSTLRSISYFAEVEDAQFDLLVQQAVRRNFGPGEVLFLEGDPSAGLWILEHGRVKAYKLAPDGQEYILRVFGPKDTFNDLAALDNSLNAVSTMAVTDISAWVIPTAVFSDMILTDHAVAIAVLRGLINRVRHLIGRVEDLALRPVTARLARFLLEQAEDPTLVHPSVTRTLIASYLATTPESISRSLRMLEQAGAIRFDRHQIIITNTTLLRDHTQL